MSVTLLSKVCVCVCFLTDLVEFTDEEGYGRYLDLHDCYLKYINLKGIEVATHHLSLRCDLKAASCFPLIAVCSSPLQKVEYIAYLSSFDQLFDISKDRKNAEYKRFEPAAAWNGCFVLLFF